MQICGVGGPELIILALLLLVVFGPERAQEVALALGRFLRRVMRSAWWRDFSRMTHEIRNLPTTLVRLAELEETQAELERSLADIRGELDINRERDVARDPWGIENAVADTTPPGERPEASLPQIDEETSPPAGAEATPPKGGGPPASP